MRTSVNYNIHFAPLQGATDALYRRLFEKHFRGVHLYYTPYLQLENDQVIKRSKFKDVECDELREKTIVQILPKDIAEFRILINAVKEFGYAGLNVNMGCPYPMVRNRGRGSGLLDHPSNFKDIIEKGQSIFGDQFSIKARTGIVDHSQFEGCLKKISNFHNLNITLHPRTAQQLYKGEASIEEYRRIVKMFPEVRWIYNGDINSKQSFVEIKNQLPTTDGWMIGRGLLKNPFLAEQINGIPSDQDLLDRIYGFLDEYFEQCLIESNDVGHAINRIYQLSIYFSHWFKKQSKVAKLFKKTKTVKDFDKTRFLLQKDYRVLSDEVMMIHDQ